MIKTKTISFNIPIGTSLFAVSIAATRKSDGNSAVTTSVICALSTGHAIDLAKTQEEVLFPSKEWKKHVYSAIDLQDINQFQPNS